MNTIRLEINGHRFVIKQKHYVALNEAKSVAEIDLALKLGHPFEVYEEMQEDECILYHVGTFPMWNHAMNYIELMCLKYLK